MKAKTAPQVRDVMTRHVHTVSPEMPMSEVMEFLARHHVTSAPVVEPDAEGRNVLIGFISEGDCLECLANEIFFGSPCPTQTVRTRMKRHPNCVDLDMDLFTLASIFVSHQHRYFPVVQDEHLVGMVDRQAVMKALEAYYRDAIHARDFEKSPPDLHEVANLRFVTKGR
jgi:CBS domain-containing protein